MGRVMEEIDDGDTIWRFDRTFLTSNWTCIWGQGCQGILPEPAPEMLEGCCSIGADLGDAAESRLVSAMAAMVDPAHFEHHEDAKVGGIFSDASRLHTRVVDGACIFFNRPGFSGGAGCALHLAAIHADESLTDWKPSVCWQLPIKVDWEPTADGREIATVRGWERRDWGEEGDTMAWCCTQGPEAYVGDSMVVESLGAELTEMVGPAVYVELRRRLID